MYCFLLYGNQRGNSSSDTCGIPHPHSRTCCVSENCEAGSPQLIHSSVARSSVLPRFHHNPSWVKRRLTHPQSSDSDNTPFTNPQRLPGWQAKPWTPLQSRDSSTPWPSLSRQLCALQNAAWVRAYLFPNHSKPAWLRVRACQPFLKVPVLSPPWPTPTCSQKSGWLLPSVLEQN